MNNTIKTTFILSLAILLAIMPAFAIESAITEPSSYGFGSVTAGQSLKSSFYANNTGTVSISNLYTELDSNKVIGILMNSSISVTFTPTSIASIPTSTKKQINYSFTVPNVYADTYNGVINVKNGASTLLSTHDFSFTISPSSSLTMTSDSPSLISGDTASFNLTLINAGNTHISAITFDKTDFVNSASSTDTIDKSNIIVSNGANVDYTKTKKWPVQITVPSGKSGTYKGNITANYDGKTVKVQVIVIVSPLQLSSSITPNNVIWAKDATTSLPISFDVTNSGNKALTDEVCTISDFKDASNNIKVAKSYLSASTFTTSSLGVGAKSTKTATLTGIPSDLAFGTYTATISCTHSSNVLMTLTYRTKTTSLDITPTSIVLGSSTQARNQTITQTITLKNSGDITLTNLQLILSQSKSKLKFTSTNSKNYTVGSLSAGQSVSVVVSATPDYGLDSGKVSVGTLQITSPDLTHSVAQTIYVQTKSMLDIEDAYIKVDGSKDDVTPSGSNTVDFKPGSSVSVTIKTGSLFSSSDNYEQDIEIKDIEVSAEIDDNDLSITETAPSFTLKAGKDHSETLTFKIPVEVENDDYDLTLKVTGEDDNNAVHTVEWIVKLTANRESKKLKLLDSTAFKTNDVYCDEIAYLNAEAMNIGDKDLDKAVLDVKSTSNGVSIKNSVTEDELTTDYADDNSRIKMTDYAIDLAANNFEAGKPYIFTITAYYDTTHSADSKQLTLTCTKRTTPVVKPATGTTTTGSTSGTSSNTGSTTGSGTGSTTTGNTQVSVGTGSTGSSQPTTTNTGSTSTQEKSSWDNFRDSEYYVPTLAGAGVSVVVIFFIFVALI